LPLQETHHYSKTLASGEVVLSIHKRIVDAVQKLETKSYSDTEQMTLISRAEEVLKEEQIWQESQLRFSDKINSLYCSWYPDLVIPLVSAATQVSLILLLKTGIGMCMYVTHSMLIEDLHYNFTV
jgi:hypothetical protein